MNDLKLITHIFKTFFSDRGINISFYSPAKNFIIDHIQRTSHIIYPLGDIYEIDYTQKLHEPKLLRANTLEYYIFVPCSTTEVRGTFICGPFLMKKLSSEDIKNVMRDFKLSPDRYAFVEEYFSSLPLVGDYQIGGIMTSIMGLSKLSSRDINLIPSLYHVKEQAQNDAVHKEDTLAELWQYDVPTANIRDINKFYHALFNASTYEDRVNVLGLYFYITEPFHHRNYPGDFDNLRHMKDTALLFMGSTLTFALQYGLDSYTTVNISSEFAKKFEEASTVEEISMLTNKMYLTFAEKVYSISRKHYSKLTNDIISFISDNVQKKITLGDIAEMTNYSQAYISNYFKKETGSTIKNFILTKKIGVAKHLLKTSDISVGDLSEYLNFSSYNHFSSTFQSIAGCRPSDYRKDFSSSITDL